MNAPLQGPPGGGAWLWCSIVLLLVLTVLTAVRVYDWGRCP